MFIVLLVVMFSCIYYLYFRHLRKPLYELSDRLPNVGSLPILGHTHWFIGGPEKLLKNIEEFALLVDKAGGTSNLWIGPSLYVVSTNPVDVQIILESCLQKDESYRFLRDWLGNGLFVAQEEVWKVHRKLMLPIFNKKFIEDYIYIFGEQSHILVKRLEEKIGQPKFDVYKYITSCMLDIVFESAMGEKMDVQQNPDTPYLKARNLVMSIINMRLFKAWLRPDALFNLTPYSKIQKQNIELTHEFTQEVIKRKRKLFDDNQKRTHEGPRDMLELLMERDLQFTDVQLREHIDSLTIAGNDTTALVISYALMLLGIHQREQELAYQELRSIFGDSMRAPTKEDINKMEYLDRVLKETMRLFSVVPVIARKTTKELKLSTCTVPAGVGLATAPFVMHKSKKIWGPDAEEFVPDRFLPENSGNRHPCAYIPFSHGTRNCIGRHFGNLVMKSLLATVLRSYKIHSQPCENFKIEIIMFPVDGHLVTIEKR